MAPHDRRQANTTNSATTTHATNASSLVRRTLAASAISKRELDGGKWMNHINTTEFEYFAVNKYHEQGPPAKGCSTQSGRILAGQPCSKRRARRRLAWESHKPGLDWSWMRSEPADPKERARERRRLHTDFDAAWVAWNASGLSTEYEELTLKVKQCLNTRQAFGRMCEEYAQYLERILDLSSLHCLVCIDNSGGRMRRLSSSQEELSSGPTWCVHTLHDLYEDTKNIAGDHILDTLANAAFAGEVNTAGIPGAVATAEQAYSFYTRMYLDQGAPTPLLSSGGQPPLIASVLCAQHSTSTRRTKLRRS